MFYIHEILLNIRIMYKNMIFIRIITYNMCNFRSETVYVHVRVSL